MPGLCSVLVGCGVLLDELQGGRLGELLTQWRRRGGHRHVHLGQQLRAVGQRQGAFMRIRRLVECQIDQPTGP